MRLSVTQLDLRGKRVFLRVDFNLPLTGEEIADDARVRAVMRTADGVVYLSPSGSAFLEAHEGREPPGLAAP